MTLRSVARAAVLAAATATAELHAQESRDTTRLATVVSTATRVPVSQAAAPVAVTVITGESLRARGITHVADALRDVPGVALAQAGSAGAQTALFLRGGESKYVKVLVDGVSVNEAGGAFDFGTLTTYNVDRIEVVRGPTSVLYGSDAVTGIVQIFTQRGRGRPHVAATARAGTYATYDSDVTLGGAAGPATFSFGVSSFRTSGIYPFNSGYRNDGLSGLVHLTPDERTEARLSVRYSDNRLHFPTTGSGVPADSNQFRSQDRLVLGLDVGRFFTPRIQGRLMLASNAADVGGANDPDSPGDSLDFYFRSISNSRRRSADANVTASLTGVAWLTLGVHAEEQREVAFTQGRSRFGPSNSPPFRATRRSRAAYTQLLMSAGEAASATFGGRYDHSETFGGFATYRLAANVRIASASRVRAAVGTAFREPQFYENFTTAFTVGNPDLRPERTASWELGASQDIGQRATLAASYFAQRFTNMIDYTFSPPAADSANYYNIARATANGVEVEGRTTTPLGLTLDASYTRLWTHVLDPGFDPSSGALLVQGARLLRRPTHSASAALTYARSSRGSISLGVHRVGDRDDRDYSGFPAAPVRLPWYTRVDVGGEVRVTEPRAGTPGATVSLRVDNVENRAYQTVYGFAAPGRAILGGFRLDF
ncbi:MAG: TonB-dependent receptor [Gemmatimonadota bacterium]|nr:TonB-dependent receptor [Gemmatimonadota bacterium]